MKIGTNNSIYCIHLIKSDFDWLYALKYTISFHHIDQ